MIIRHLYKKEDMLSIRSRNMVVLITIFNIILFFISIIRLNIEVQNIKISFEMKYDIFLTTYRYVSIIEYIILILILPAGVIGSVSNERNSGKLDLLLGSMATPGEIIFAKILSAMSNVMAMLISIFPIPALGFIYGGLDVADLAVLIISYISLSLFLISLGVFLSSICRNTELVAIINYASLFIMIFMLYVITRNIFGINLDIRLFLDDIGRVNYKSIPPGFLISYIMIQLILSVLFTIGASISIDPKKRFIMF